MIEFIHGIFNFTFCNGCQIPVFREVLSNEAIGIFIQSTLPRGIRMREVDASFKVTGHAFVVGKFTSVVIGSSKHPFYVWGEPVYDSVSDSLSRFVKDGSDDRIQRLALDQCHQRTPVALILFEPYRFLIRPLFTFPSAYNKIVLVNF